MFYRLKEEYRTAERAVTLGIPEATNGLKMSMRCQVYSSGLGSRMAKTWRGDIDPRGQNSIRAAGWFTVKPARSWRGTGHAIKRWLVAGCSDAKCAKARYGG